MFRVPKKPPQRRAGEATRTVRIQAADWRGYQDRVAGAAPPAEAAAGRVAAGKIGTTVEEKLPAAAPGRDQLKVSPQVGKGAAASPAAEEVVARDQALKEAQTRIGELEKTLKDLQRALELKGQTGAQLQAQADAAKGKAPEPAEGRAAEGASRRRPRLRGAGDRSAREPPKAEPPRPSPSRRRPPRRPKRRRRRPTSRRRRRKANRRSSTISSAASRAGSSAGARSRRSAGVAALIAARRRKTVKFEDSIIGGTDIKTNTVFGSTGGGVVNTGENSLATDFSREGLGSIDTDEVDPIAEAEVYLAYGRDAQAEEILKDALRKDPQRQEIYLKLLEIHAQHNKPSAFETVAAELYSVSQGKGEAWQKAVTLGRQLDPNNPMFGEGGAAAAAAAAAGAGRRLRRRRARGAVRKAEG